MGVNSSIRVCIKKCIGSESSFQLWGGCKNSLRFMNSSILNISAIQFECKCQKS